MVLSERTTEEWRRTGPDIGDTTLFVFCWPTVRYVGPDGVERTLEVPHAASLQSTPGQPVNLLVNPADPTDVQVEPKPIERAFRTGALVVVAVVGGTFVVGGGIAILVIVAALLAAPSG
jgi:hypothetical protein